MNKTLAQIWYAFTCLTSFSFARASNKLERWQWFTSHWEIVWIITRKPPLNHHFPCHFSGSYCEIMTKVTKKYVAKIPSVLNSTTTNCLLATKFPHATIHFFLRHVFSLGHIYYLGTNKECAPPFLFHDRDILQTLFFFLDRLTMTQNKTFISMHFLFWSTKSWPS